MTAKAAAPTADPTIIAIEGLLYDLLARAEVAAGLEPERVDNWVDNSVREAVREEVAVEEPVVDDSINELLIGSLAEADAPYLDI
jgi:hypothetical protein